jgi:hypothetical protein
VAVWIPRSVRVRVLTRLNGGETFMIWHLGRILSATKAKKKKSEFSGNRIFDDEDGDYCTLRTICDCVHTVDTINTVCVAIGLVIRASAHSAISAGVWDRDQRRGGEVFCERQGVY